MNFQNGEWCNTVFLKKENNSRSCMELGGKEIIEKVLGF